MVPKPWTIKSLLDITTDYLKKKQIESPRLNAEVLLANQLSIDRIALYLNFDKPLNESEISGYRLLIKRRLRREPLQYITGVQEFWSLEFLVDSRVLIPRPESELLVELAIDRISSLGTREDHWPRILDLGTGCGALAISLAKNIQEIRIWATDISPGAIEIARLNAKRHGVSDSIKFVEGDLWEPLTNQGKTFDIILSNPPYIASEEYNDLPPEVCDYEPMLALKGHEEGMYFIEKIIVEGLDFLNPGGWIMIEMAPDQTEKALRIMEQIKSYGEKSRIKDYSHLYRVVTAKNIPPGS
ncbi:MAG TPA: peptide chain release factor N(5)-glutamine methyltransferase [Desulfobacteraceae bacterium]|nr:peptide chain release factor N(5)-glutamine methyltransferase [Desulfobacteraceae bacterium]